MTVREIKMNFGRNFEGELFAPRHQVKVGVDDGTLEPYDMLFGALGSCVYATFLDIVNKKKITFDRAEVIVTGEKRKELPATLKWVNIEFVIYGAENNKGIEKSSELAAKYCSIYTTIAQVAEMKIITTFA
ncbi:MAG: OsmC family protein [Bacillota bacterium]|nr:OsmC family protein [Bacillota bacterium]